jgi:RimJ/RimL family protein N-acetyltransferase
VSAGPAGLGVSSAGRIVIRERTLADAPDEYRWRRDEELARFDGTRPTTLPYSAFIEEFRRDLRFVEASRAAFAIDTHDGIHIGSIIFYNGDHSGSRVEIGMSIGERDYWSDGYGREAAIAFLRYLWDQRPFATVYLHAFDWNTRAIRCFAGLGFEEVRRLVRDDTLFVEMETHRNWWLFWDNEGRFERYIVSPANA